MSTKRYSVKVNGKQYDVEVEDLGSNAASASVPVLAAPVVHTQAPIEENTQASAVGEGSPVLAPINGTILSVAAKVSDVVKKGDLLCILEAMKMENEVFAPQDGTITAVNISKGSAVGAGDALFYIQ